jgi:hypothetical protein
MSRFDLRMSHRLDADIFSPYIPPDFAELSRKPVPEKEPGKIVNAFISSHINKSGRLQYLIGMMKVLGVHSYGRMIPNMPSRDDYGHQFKLDTISRYKFTIAFENAIAAPVSSSLTGGPRRPQISARRFGARVSMLLESEASVRPPEPPPNREKPPPEKP